MLWMTRHVFPPVCIGFMIFMVCSFPVWDTTKIILSIFFIVFMLGLMGIWLGCAYGLAPLKLEKCTGVIWLHHKQLLPEDIVEIVVAEHRAFPARSVGKWYYPMFFKLKDGTTQECGFDMDFLTAVAGKIAVRYEDPDFPFGCKVAIGFGYFVGTALLVAAAATFIWPQLRMFSA